jgi:hypothetical protein
MGLSTLLSRGPRSLSAAHCGPVLSLHVRAPLPVPRGPPATGPACSQESYHPGEPLWGSAHSSHEAPIPFRPHFAAMRPGFEFSPCARAGPEAAVVVDEGVSVPGELFRPSRCCPPPRSSPRGPWSIFLHPHVQINVSGPLHVLMLRMQAVGPGTRPLQLLTVY